MTPKDLLAAYTKMARRHHLSPMKRTVLKVESSTIGDPQTAWQELQRLAPLEGWVQFQSHLAAFGSGELPDAHADWGLLLAAEGIDSQGRSIHLRQDGAGGLKLVIAASQPIGAGAMGQETYFADRVSHLATDKALGERVCYRRYWRLDSDLGAIPVFAAFQGFAPTE